MNAKNTFFLVVACAILAYFGLQSPQKKKGDTVVKDPTPFSEMDLNRITSVVVKKGSDELTISKEGEQWRAKGGELDYPIDFSQLREKLFELQKTELLSRVAQDKKIDDKFGLDEASQPTIVTIKAGEETLSTLELGKGRPSKAPANPSPFGGFPPQDVGQFMRLSKSQDVFMAKEKLNFNTRSNTWMNSSLVKVEKDEITNVDLMFPDKHVILSKEVNTIETSTDGSTPPQTVTTWKLSGDLSFETNSSEIKTWLDQIDDISVSEPVAAHTSSQFIPANTFGISVSRGDESLYQLSLCKVENNWYVWKKDLPKEIYQISSYNVENIFGKNDKILSLPEVKMEGEAKELQWGDVALKLDGDVWALTGTTPTPEVDHDKAKEVASALATIKPLDVLPKLDPSAQSLRTLVASGNNKLTIVDYGETHLRKAHVIKVGDKVLVVSSDDTEKLFPENKDLLKITTPIEKLEDLSSLENSHTALSFADDTWTLKDGRKAKESSVKSWHDAWNSVFESTYTPQKQDFKTALTIKAEIKGGLHLSLDISEAKEGYCMVQSSIYGGTFRVQKDVIQSLQNNADSFAEEESEN